MRSDQQANEGIDRGLTQLPAVSSKVPQVDLLIKTVENELIPRLFVNHMMNVPGSSRLIRSRTSVPTSGSWSSDAEIERFAAFCVANQTAALQSGITDLLTQGISLESIYLYLLTPVANYLGDQWSQDQLSFIEVHLGMCCLQQLVIDCESIGYFAPRETNVKRSVLLSSTPGEDHTFGITVLADFFRRYGWYVSNLSGLEAKLIMERVKYNRYTIVGFSLHSADHYASLKQLIADIRAESLNANIEVLVGGHYFVNNPNKVEAVGADACASNGFEAVLHASKTHLKMSEVGV